MPVHKPHEEDIWPHFVTCTIVEWLPVFVTAPAFNVVVDSLQYCCNNKGLRLHAYVIMPTHLHLIASVEENHKLSNCIRDFKRHTTKQLCSLIERHGPTTFLAVFEAAAREERGTEHQIWQSGYHPEGLFSELFYFQKRNYLHDNPVRKGLVAQACDWLHSSARNYSYRSPCVLDIEPVDYGRLPTWEEGLVGARG